MDLRLRTTLLCVGAATALALTGCSSSGTTSTKPSSSATGSASASASASPSVSAPASPPASSAGSGGPSTAPSGGGVRPLSFSDNGKAVTLHVGERLHVALDSPFWTFQPVDAAQVLRTDSTAVAKATTGCPHPMGSGGCGTQTADFTAVGAGRTSVVATREICGEAMRCTGSSARFEVSITVTG